MFSFEGWAWSKIKEIKKISAVLCFFSFLVIKILDPDSLEMLDPDPDAMNPDPQLCFAGV